MVTLPCWRLSPTRSCSGSASWASSCSAKYLISGLSPARPSSLPAASTSSIANEFVAKIVDYVPVTARNLTPGTRVISLPALVTPQGIEGIGYSNDNIGGYAEAMLLSEPLLLEVPNGLAPEHAALTEPLAVGVHA